MDEAVPVVPYNQVWLDDTLSHPLSLPASESLRSINEYFYPNNFIRILLKVYTILKLGTRMFNQCYWHCSRILLDLRKFKMEENQSEFIFATI